MHDGLQRRQNACISTVFAYDRNPSFVL